ncbi:hypothetical protein ABC383_02660 [Noviherbaspirillum sp. 1P10PC]|uniref:hypothetical protein n=1 Tax=Noviherbaspirillum sp. 1P10PC TaxID=3132292 RepID=UPI0039A15EFC
MRRITQVHFDHTQALFLSERSRREGIRGSLGTPVAAISFAFLAVLALSSRSVGVNPERWCQLPTLLILLPGLAAAAAAGIDLPLLPRRLMTEEEQAVLLSPDNRTNLSHHDN